MIEGTYKILVPSWSPKQGLVTWENENGATVLQLHYSADPDKSEAWAEEFSKTFPGGMEGPLWQQEMEIEWEAKSGSRVYPEVSERTHVVEPYQIPADAPKWRVIDPGLHDPLCCLWIAWTKDPATGDKHFVVYREHYRANWTLEQHAPVITKMSGDEEYELTLIDPVAFRATLEGGEASIGDRFARMGIRCSQATRSSKKHLSIPRLAELVRLQSNGHPLLKFMRNCPMTYRDMSQLRYEEKRESHLLRKNPGERPLDVNDHACDCLIYFACTVNGERAEKRRKQRKERVGGWARENWVEEAEYVGVE